ncbi:MAG: S8 family serine peptidase [Flavobacteriales bacterium]|nr:S8 family serine peptidase [Bacteroidota bacterium]MCB9241733.1 S8 family serine peptidase [Flavobacteriales bacterium]
MVRNIQIALVGLMLVILLPTKTIAQENMEKVWVFLADKDTTQYNPYTFLDPKAIERRQINHVPVFHVSDVPVNPIYVGQIQTITGNIRAESRWFNAICCLATPQQISELKKLAFVVSVKTTERPLEILVSGRNTYQDHEEAFVPDADEINFLNAQRHRMGEAAFKKYKIDGNGVRVAVFDVGFKSYKTNPAFEHIRKDNRIKATWDFVKKKENVDAGGTHGTFVLSCIAGRIQGVDMGLATGAEFLLARTETWTEFYSEEENWLMAAEWADKNGADIINSSLGYTYHRYFREEMDGQHSLVAKAANMAASKGILVVNSAGNEGGDKWKFIGTPADADSVLSIGGIHPITGIHTSFSSFGPTRDKRLKPNVTAYGHVIGSGPKGVSETQGTSFSGPLVAGFAACARQSRPSYPTMKLFHEIEQSADLYPYYDYAHGYGVPQASYFFRTTPLNPAPTFTVEEKGDRIYIRIKSAEKVNSLNPADSVTYKENGRYIQWPDYVFYHIENETGYLAHYWVVDPVGSLSNKILEMIGEGSDSPLAGEGPLVIRRSQYPKPFTLRVHYRGYTQSIEIK